MAWDYQYKKFIMVKLMDDLMIGIGVWQLLILALIIIVLFGTKKIRGLGSDVGVAMRELKDAISYQPETRSNNNNVEK